MDIEVRKMLWDLQNEILEMRESLNKVHDKLDPTENIRRDKVRWAAAKLCDLERLLNSIK